MIANEIASFIQNSKCLVTGGAGFIGSNLVEELLRIGSKKVIVLDDLSTGNKENLSSFDQLSNYQFVRGSITDYETCLNTLKDVDIVFQMAALGSVPRSIDNPIKTNEVNVSGFLNVLCAAKEAGVKKIVYSSSSSIYGDDATVPKLEEKTGNPLSPYAVSKKSNELYAKVFSDIYGMDIIGLRYFNVFGPKQSLNGPYAAVIPIFINNLMKQQPCYINGDGSISRDFTYVMNVVEANILAAYAKVERQNKIFNIAMGDQLSLNQLYEIIEGEIKSGLTPIHREKRLGDILSSLADISKAQKYLGYQPQYSFQDGIRKTIDWYKLQP